MHELMKHNVLHQLADLTSHGDLLPLVLVPLQVLAAASPEAPPCSKVVDVSLLTGG